MITKLEKLPTFTKVNDAAIHIKAQVKAYGFEQSFLNVYQMDDICVFSVMDGVLTVYPLSNRDYSELIMFIQMTPSIQTIRTDCQTADKISSSFCGEKRICELLEYHSEFHSQSVEDKITPKDAYKLLKRVFSSNMPSFDNWYVDVSHKIRHFCCNLVGIREENELVATAMTVAETDDEWVIGAVATDKDYRNRGYASRLVLSLCSIGKRQGKRVFISPKNENAHNLYKKIGFSEFDTYCIIERK